MLDGEASQVACAIYLKAMAEDSRFVGVVEETIVHAVHAVDQVVAHCVAIDFTVSDGVEPVGNLCDERLLTIGKVQRDLHIADAVGRQCENIELLHRGYR